MKINKLTASFGKLENETLSFHSGLNVIYAPNESGKSTWCAFIRAMLYGVDSSQRGRAGALPDKVKYAPWSGAPMEGAMELTAAGCDITLTRTTKTKNAPMRDFSAVYSGTGIPVENITAQNVGEMLTGVSKDVFRRSAFVEQGTVAVTGTPELEKRIASIVSTGEEQTSYSEADERLRAWQRKRRYNRRGLLPELEVRIDETNRELAEISDTYEEIGKAEQALDEAKDRCAALEAEVNESRKKQRRMALDKLNSGRSALRECSEKHDQALDELSSAKDELRKSRFGSVSPEEAEESVKENLDELDALRAAVKKRNSPLLAVLFFLLAAAGAALYTVYSQMVYVIAAGVACVAAVFLIIRWARLRRGSLDADYRRREILKEYGAASAKDIRLAVDRHAELWDAVMDASQHEYETRCAYEDALEAQQSYEAAALDELDFAGGSSDAARLSHELAQSRKEADRLSTALAHLKGRFASYGDPLVLSSDLKRLEQEYSDISDEYDAIDIALEALKAADTDIQSRFSPRLGQLAAQYMSLMTDGRYEDVLINRDFTAKIRASGDSVARESEYLSAGTLDLMYLAVRLAVCELALPEGESCPLIIDDALVNLDEQRTQQALDLLKEIARRRQVILFSCKK